MTTRKPRILPGLTKTQALRQAKSATVIREYEQKQETVRPKPQPALADPGRRRRYTPAEPRRVDFSKPAMTKAMMARMKHAEKFQRELFERKQEETMRRRPRRTPAPIGGDPRCISKIYAWFPSYIISIRSLRSFRMLNVTLLRNHQFFFLIHILNTVLTFFFTPLHLYRFGRERLPPTRRAPTPSPPVSPPRPTRMPERRVPEPLPAIPERTKELARSMNAQVIQAEPVGEGPIDSIVIPPRSVDENRTTIVSIPQPPMASMQATNSEVANRSIRVIR